MSVRDPEAWYISTQETIFAKPWMDWLENSEAAAYIFGTINNYFDNRMQDHDHLISRFNQHIEDVTATIAPERLLVFDVKQGWGPLCEFLELPVPNGEFPHVNDTAATQELIRSVMEDGFEQVFGY